MRKYEGSSRVLLLPRTTQQVSLILRHCNDRRLAIVPQGGNTGLVGGGVPVHDEVILGTRRMNRVLRVDPSAGVVVAEAGVVLENLETALNAHGMTVPLDLGAKGKCQIGGNVSTNAGGLRLLRHGSLHGSVLGVEVALADGSILDLLSVARKDNTGYDLKQLFIGAEGTLGVVTKVALLAPRLPARVDVAFVAAPDFASCVAMLRDARSRLGDVLHAFAEIPQPRRLLRVAPDRSGDGNLHLNVSSPTGYDAALERVLEPFVYEWTAARRGSVSAEHGVGAMKPGELRHSKPPEAVALMRGIKRLMDPKGILNPYKVLPPEEGVVVRR